MYPLTMSPSAGISPRSTRFAKRSSSDPGRPTVRAAPKAQNQTASQQFVLRVIWPSARQICRSDHSWLMLRPPLLDRYSRDRVWLQNGDNWFQQVSLNRKQMPVESRAATADLYDVL